MSLLVPPGDLTDSRTVLIYSVSALKSKLERLKRARLSKRKKAGTTGGEATDDKGAGNTGAGTEPAADE